MELLKGKDFRALQEFLQEIYAIRDLDAFAKCLITSLPRVLPSDITAFNEVNPQLQRVTGVINPAESITPELQRIFDEHLDEYPLLEYLKNKSNDQTVKFSDFITRKQLHRLGIYNEFYRRMGVEYQMVTTIPAPPPLWLWVVVNRRLHDFSERDRFILNLLRPHLIQGYRNAEAVSRMERNAGQLKRTFDELEWGLIIFGRDRRVQFANPRGRQLLRKYFGSALREGMPLVEALERWVKFGESRLLKGLPREPLVIERGEKQLIVRLISSPSQRVLLLEERIVRLSPSSFEFPGLTRRESEALYWAAQGKTNGEIATILGISRRTVDKYMEHIFPKLGVETRTAAAMRMTDFLKTEAGRD